MQPVHTWDAQLYNEKYAFVYDYGKGLIELLAPQQHERILDLGCGSGELTAAIGRLADSVVGIDKSPEMITRAKEQFPTCEFEVADAVNFEFEKAFDAIFSNATLHWVLDYKEAVKNMYRNLTKGGRLVAEFGGKDNVKAIVDELKSCLIRWGYVRQGNLVLWYFPSIAEYTTVLESHGFTVTFAQWYDRPTELADEDAGITDWLQMFGKPFFERVHAEDATEIRKEVQENLKSRLFKNGKWYADYKRIRVVAIK